MITDLDTCLYSVLWIIQRCWVVQWQTQKVKWDLTLQPTCLCFKAELTTTISLIGIRIREKRTESKRSHKHCKVFAPFQLKDAWQSESLLSIVQELRFSDCCYLSLEQCCLRWSDPKIILFPEKVRNRRSQQLSAGSRYPHSRRGWFLWSSLSFAEGKNSYRSAS